MVMNLPTIQETQFRSLGREDCLENGMTAHSSLLDLENHTDRGAWLATGHSVAKSDRTERVTLSLSQN